MGNNSVSSKSPSVYLGQFQQAQGAQNTALGNDAALIQQLQAASQGQGPNPAQNMLNQATTQNVNNQAALAASVRGANANPGLIASQAARAGSQAQQQAAGQAATLGAQQQIAARDQLGQAINQQGQLGLGQQQIAGNMLNAQLGAQTQKDLQNMQTTSQLAGGALSGLGSAAMMLAQGGLVPGYSQGGPISGVGQYLAMNKGGKVPAMLSPGEGYLPPRKAQEVAKGKASAMEAKKVPGKAVIKGDSPKNDTVRTTLEEGGVVIPRSVMQSDDPGKKAAAFVKAVMARQKMR